MAACLTVEHRERVAVRGGHRGTLWVIKKPLSAFKLACVQMHSPVPVHGGQKLIWVSSSLLSTFFLKCFKIYFRTGHGDAHL